MTAEVAKMHLSLHIDLPKKAPESNQVLEEPDESPGNGRDLEISHSSRCDELKCAVTLKPKFPFDFDISAAAYSLNPCSFIEQQFNSIPVALHFFSLSVWFFHWVLRSK